MAEYTYDALNRLTYLENRRSDGTIISSYTYTLDDAGNRTKVVEHSGRTVEYTYDDTYKLLEEKITNPDSSVSIISYTYDAVGNRLTKTENGFTTTYQYNENNQLVKEDDITYSYDDNGNLKAKNSAEETVEYFYDAENHLTRVETTRFGVTIVVEYEYDAEGKKMGRWGEVPNVSSRELTLKVGCWKLETGNWKLVTGCWMLDVGCWMLGTS